MLNKEHLSKMLSDHETADAVSASSSAIQRQLVTRMYKVSLINILLSQFSSRQYPSGNARRRFWLEPAIGDRLGPFCIQAELSERKTVSPRRHFAPVSI